MVILFHILYRVYFLGILYLSTYYIMGCIMKTYSDLLKLLQSKGFTAEEAESFVKIEKNMKGAGSADNSAECGDDVYSFYESRSMIEIDPTKAW